jgi:hypothetical protein
MKNNYKFYVDGSNAFVLGKLILEDPQDEWLPFIGGVQMALARFNELTINFRVEGMVSSNKMYIMYMLKFLNDSSLSNNVKVNWNYLSIDEDMEFYAQELKDLLPNLNIELISVEGNVLNEKI